MWFASASKQALYQPYISGHVYLGIIYSFTVATGVLCLNFPGIFGSISIDLRWPGSATGLFVNPKHNHAVLAAMSTLLA